MPHGETENTSTLDADLLVLGAGMAGLSAAASAVANGLRVVLVEKGDWAGGSALYAGYVWTAPTYEVMRAVNPDGDPGLAHVVVDGLEKGFTWIGSLDVPMGPLVPVLGYGRGRATDLAAYIRACQAKVREGGTLIMPAVPQRLLQDAGGVHGAVVLEKDREVTIHSTYTLLATGGFGGNPDLRAQRISPAAHSLALRANRNSVGDGLRLGMAAGAGFAGEGAGFYGHLIPSHIAYEDPNDFVNLTFYHSEHGILANLAGRRFCDETLGDHLNTLAVLDQPDARALLVCDERVHREWMLKPYVAGATAPDKFRLAYQRGARAAAADDLDELASLPPEWGFDGAELRETIIDFNKRCLSGEITPGRAVDNAPLEEPPYYVIEVVPAITNTWGGLRVDDHARVLRADGSPIDGLLAAGADIGGLYQRAYGGGLAAGLTFGLRAAETALISLRAN